MSSERRVDFFVSYTRTDVKWAEWAAGVLEEAGFATLVQVWDFLPGSNFVLAMHDALRRSDRVLALLSEEYLRSVVAATEWAGAFATDPEGQQGRLVPVRVKKCEPEGLLRTIVYVDLVGLEEAEAKQRLLAAVTRRRAKPSSPVRFTSALDQGRAAAALLPSDPSGGDRTPDRHSGSRPPVAPQPRPGPVRRPRPQAPGGRVLALALAVAVLLAGGLAGVVARSVYNNGPSPTTTTAPDGLPPGRDLAEFNFDALAAGTLATNGRVTDTSGSGNDGTVLVEAGGKITVVARTPAGGNALKFPDPCQPGPAGACPRAIVQTEDPSPPSMNAGDRDFAYGADVLVRPTEVSAGAAILNKGRVTRADDSEWKLQLEPDGRVSCVAVTPGTGPAIQAASTVGIADGRWHRVTCTRTESELSVDVGGVTSRATLPRDVRFETNAPLRLGGSSREQDNAQFFGHLDNVFFRLAGS